MATRTTYTTTIKLPIYAYWKCQNCDAINYSDGLLRFSKAASSSSLRMSKQIEAQEKASKLANEGWKQFAFNLMDNTAAYKGKLEDLVSLREKRCRCCKKGPSWLPSLWLKAILSLAIIPLLVCILFVGVFNKSIVAWIAFSFVAGTVLFCAFMLLQSKRITRKMSDEYLPIFGSYNADLIAYAESKGTKMITPQEAKEILQRNSRQLFGEKCNYMAEKDACISTNKGSREKCTTLDEAKDEYERIRAKAEILSDKTIEKMIDESISKLSTASDGQVKILQARMKALREIQAKRL